jgi:hypothetical protein
VGGCGVTQSHQCLVSAVDPQTISPDSPSMAFARTILAALIAISIALLPAAGGAAVSTKPVEMSITNQTDMPCCPPPDEGNGSVACAFKCCNFMAIMFPTPVALSPIAETLPAAFFEGTLRGHISPPTHPPPI